MQLYRTVENENFLRLEEDGGSSITLYLEGKRAEIVSLLVEEEDRRQGIGRALLQASEQELYDHGVETVEADYRDTLTDLTGLFDACDYEVSEGAALLSVSIRDLLSAEKVRAAMARGVPGTKYASLEELMMMQWDELFALIRHHGLRLSGEDLNGFSQILSGVAYTMDDVPQAFILCRESGRTIQVEFFGVMEGQKQNYAVALFQGLLYEVISCGGAKAYDELVFVAEDSRVESFLDGILGEKHSPQMFGHVMCAIKDISEAPDDYLDIDDDVSDEMENEWRREIKKIPMQQNIGWKSAWQRQRIRQRKMAAARAAAEQAMREEAVRVEEELARLGSAEGQEEDAFGAGEDGLSDGRQSAFPGDTFAQSGDDSSDTVVAENGSSFTENDDTIAENDDSFTENAGASPEKKEAEERIAIFSNDVEPFAIDIDYDEEEDEYGDIIAQDCRRIVRDNLEDYLNCFPLDLAQNMARPFYRALVVQSGDRSTPGAILAWEFLNIDDEGENGAEIHWFRVNDEEDGRTVLEEFAREMLRKKVLRVSLELSEPSETEKALLGEAEFSLEDGESRDLVVSAADITKLRALSGKPGAYVKKLSDIGERQFKRGLGNCLYHNRKGVLQDMAYLPMEWFENDLSCGVITDERVTGLFLMHRTAGGLLFLDLMFAAGANGRADNAQLMLFAAQALREEDAPDTKVLIRRHTKEVRELTAKLFPGKRGAAVIIGGRDYV